MLPTGVTKLDNKPTPDADRFLSLPPGAASELAGVEIFGQTSKYPRVECRSMGVGIGLGIGIGLVLHMTDMIWAPPVYLDV